MTISESSIREALASFVHDEGYRSNRYAVIDNNETDYSEGADVAGYYETFDAAVAAWETFMKEDPDGSFNITGWGASTLAFHIDVRDLFAEPRGTFECPICYKATPHEHTAQQIADHRKYEKENQAHREKKRAEILSRVASIEEHYGARPNLDGAVKAVLTALGFSHSADGNGR